MDGIMRRLYTIGRYQWMAYLKIRHAMPIHQI